MRGDRARTALKETRFADIRWVDETGSTNHDLAELARGGASDSLVLVAEYQSRGRGRLERDWQAPPGASLLVSILLRPSPEIEEIGLITAAVVVSAAEACALIAPFSPGIKWPNDLVVVSDDSYDGRKLAGVLAEGIPDGDRIAAVVVGLGLNVNWPRDLPPDLADRAVGLRELVGQEVDREGILIEMLRRLQVWLERMTDPAGRGELLDRYRQMSATIGRRVRVTMFDEVIEGTAVDVSNSGYLLVQVDGDEQPREIVVGDVVHLRHA